MLRLELLGLATTARLRRSGEYVLDERGVGASVPRVDIEREASIRVPGQARERRRGELEVRCENRLAALWERTQAIVWLIGLPLSNGKSRRHLRELREEIRSQSH
jgi:hypothetical protein